MKTVFFVFTALSINTKSVCLSEFVGFSLFVYLFFSEFRNTNSARQPVNAEKTEVFSLSFLPNCLNPISAQQRTESES